MIISLHNDLQDDHGYTVLHWAASFDLPQMIALVLDGSKSDLVINSHPKLTGFTALHVAADSNAAAAASILLKRGANITAVTSCLGMTPLHIAASKGARDVWKILIDAGASDSLVDSMGRTPLALLAQNTADGPTAGDGSGGTAIVAHEFCSVHFTCPPSIVHTNKAPPENMRRLQLLVDQRMGALRSTDLSNKLLWIPQKDVKPAALSDVLRVHEWSYIRHLQAQCEAIESFDPEDEISGLGQLDADTTISKGTFQAALAAAGAVCTAVDKVASGAVRNAFCPVRPPGHHAGPRGVVKGEIEGSDSHGFCILNNVSIGASYAMNMYRDKVKKVAIIDFGEYKF